MLERNLETFDRYKNPLYDLRSMVVGRTPVRGTKPLPPRPEDKHAYVPSWWRGEDAAARVALKTMTSLPK